MNLPEKTPLLELGPVESLDKFIQEKDMGELDSTVRTQGAEQYPTPLTDAFAARFTMSRYGFRADLEAAKAKEWPEFSRQLERDRAELIGVLKELSDMYAFTWDREDGSLVMMDAGVVRFEDAHDKARNLLAKLR